jgi:hypothetical protein
MTGPSLASLVETRARVLRQVAERYGLEDRVAALDLAVERGETSSLRIVTPAELEVVARTGYATRGQGGATAFDWGLVERAIGRTLGALDHRVLREAACPPDEPAIDPVAVRLDALAAQIEAAIG